MPIRSQRRTTGYDERTAVHINAAALRVEIARKKGVDRTGLFLAAVRQRQAGVRAHYADRAAQSVIIPFNLLAVQVERDIAFDHDRGHEHNIVRQTVAACGKRILVRICRIILIYQGCFP